MPNLALSFHGGARMVTGACYLLEAGSLSQDSGRSKSSKKILIDCGLIQGQRFCESKNSQEFGFDPATIDALFVTHGHLDHVGRIPKLVREGFNGMIYSTAPTKELAALMLEDGYGILEHEARNCREDPPYGPEHIAEALTMWETVEYENAVAVGETSVVLKRAGHILGSAMVEITAEGKKIVFSGDLGATKSLLLPPADPVEAPNYLIIESAYGDRAHPTIADARLGLERAVEDTVSRGGTLMIPAFATERTQDILFLLNELVTLKRVPDIPVFVDSPLAIKVTAVFEKYRNYYSDEIQKLFQSHPNLFKSRSLHFTPTVDESKGINEVKPPKVVVAGSGMMTGGRILHHLVRYLPDPKSTLLVVGYQAAGSLGRRIMDGASAVRVLGQDIPARAKVLEAHGFSAHADKNTLYQFVGLLRDSLEHVFTVQGEERSATALAQEIRDKLGIAADAPELHQRFEL